MEGKSLRTIVILGALGALAVPLGSQSVFDGDWRGAIRVQNPDRAIEVRLEISGKKVVQSFADDRGEWHPSQPVFQDFRAFGNNALFYWIDWGEVWTESQIFSLAAIDAQTLHLVYLRHVNDREGQASGEDWSYGGEGELKNALAGPTADSPTLSDWLTSSGIFSPEGDRFILQATNMADGYRFGRVFWKHEFSGDPSYEVKVKFRRLDGQEDSPMEVFFLGGSFAITEGGSFFFWEHEGGQFSGWMPSSAIRAGQDNEVRIRHLGRSLTAWVNGTQVSTFRLTRPIAAADDKISIFIKGEPTGPNPKLAFWDFHITMLK